MMFVLGKKNTFNLKLLKKYHVLITTHFSLSKGKKRLNNTDLS